MTPDDDAQQSIAHLRIRQVFEYLKALNECRNPAVRQIKEQPWFMWLDDLPEHPAIDLSTSTLAAGADDQVTPPTADTCRFRARRPTLTPSPSPPAQIGAWLRAGWDDPAQEVNPAACRNHTDARGDTITIGFYEDPARVVAFNEWLERRARWRQAELPARRAMDVFNRLYALHGRLEREPERLELLIGDGLLSCQHPDGNLYHPLLVQRAQLVFAAGIPEFKVVDADSCSELNTSLLQSIPGVDACLLAALRQELDAGGYHPLAVETNAFLAGLAHRLSAHGSFTAARRPQPASPAPSVGRGAVLFLRWRASGYGHAITQVLESLESRKDFCQALHNIVGAPRSVKEPNAGGAHAPRPRELPDQDVLFGKDANPEQLRIAQELDRHGAVLVQGPPGTGKSHTIANLIGHLLARGQSVLVTSHTTKALRVLREHIVEQLRPLCVSVLDSDLDSRRQLEVSVRAISSMLSEADPEELDREALSLAERRRQVAGELRRSEEELCAARADEYRALVLAGKAWAPADAARQVAAGRHQHDWIPSPVALGEALPLSTEEVRELYATNARVLPEDDQLVHQPLPEPAELLTPEDFEKSQKESKRLASKGPWEPRRWPDVRFTPCQLVAVRDLTADVRETIAAFKRLDGWCLAAVDAGRVPATRGLWQHLLDQIEETRTLVARAELDFIKYRPEIAGEPALATQAAAARAIEAHLARAGTLGCVRLWWQPAWRSALEAWRVHGRTPVKREEVAAIQQWLHVKMARAELALLWDDLMTPHGAPHAADLGDEPERAAGQFTARIQECLAWWNQRCAPILERLHALGFDWERFLSDEAPDVSKYGETARILTAFESRLLAGLESTAVYLHSLSITGQREEALRRLQPYDRPEVAELRRMLERRDAPGYRLAYTRCLEALRRSGAARRRQRLLALLERPTRSGTRIAAAWADCIRKRLGQHGGEQPPGNAALAWEWRQLNDELDRRAQADLEELGQKIARLRQQLQDITIQLIKRRAWAAQVRRTSLCHRQALMGWLAILNRMGKGFGIRVPQLRRAAQQKMEECREAVPVWIMPLARLVEHFGFGAARFDVVIIDEASQCDTMALLALALAKKVVVVGDDQQVSPLAVGQQQEGIGKLIRLHLEGIPNAVLYDGRMSLYDLAKQSFAGCISLVEHFRCLPDIIQFSNHLCYDGAIRPLRAAAHAPLRPAVVPYRVEGNYDPKTKLNHEEALTVAALVAAALEHEAFRGLTFGVISLLGDAQAIAIEQTLLRRLTPEVYARRQILCGSAAHFQGDERDVVFLSLVHSAGAGPLPLLDRPEARQRFNVATSRARNQLWVVYSLNPDTDLKPADIRRRLIEHALDPSALTRELASAAERTESVFERQVLERLVRNQYRVRPQWVVGRYRIDLVVEGAGQRLAIECDGDRYHPLEKLPQDMARQATLERLGWRFLRLRGSAFFRDPEGTMVQVFKRLEALGIAPEGAERERITPPASDLVQELTRHAAQIRGAWQTAEKKPSAPDPDAPHPGGRAAEVLVTYRTSEFLVELP